ncbi:Cytochrome P450 78A5 [Glycine max]|nr:Cytochrome P450 78A5 [Glycine max]
MFSLRSISTLASFGLELGPKWGGGCELKELVNERYDLLGSNYFPLLGLLDLQGVRKRCKSLVDKVNHEVKKVVEGKDKNRVIESSSDFVDEIIFRGIDIMAILLKWILAKMSEIDPVVGINCSVSDGDLPNLPYVRAIVKETLRMHTSSLFSFQRPSIPYTTHKLATTLFQLAPLLRSKYGLLLMTKMFGLSQNNSGQSIF